MKKIYRVSIILCLSLIIEENIPIIFHLKGKLVYSSLILYKNNDERKIIFLGE